MMLFLCIALCGALAWPAAGTAAPRDFFGVSSQSPLVSEDFRRMGKARVGTLRALLSWPSVQSEKGPCGEGPFDPDQNVCRWGGYDSLVGRAAAAGVEVFSVVSGSPRFVAKKPSKPPIKRGDRKAWKRFLKAAVRRYGPGGAFWQGPHLAYGVTTPVPITRWQIWNEPGSPDHFSKPSPRKYAKLVKISESAIKKADSGADVVLAGLFARPNRARGGIDFDDFLRRLFKVRRVERSFDAAAMHPYAAKVRGVKKQVKRVRRLMKKGGAKRKRLWVTEIGWASGGPKKNKAVTSPKGQKRNLKKSFRFLRKKRRRFKIGGLHWFSWRDISKRSPNACNFCPKTGLLKRSGKPKPAYRAFKKFT